MKNMREKPKLKTKSKPLTKQKQAKYDALTIAKYLFSLDPERKYFSTKKISTSTGLSSIILGNFRLNQMLYLLQIFYYVKNHQFLFRDDLYAFDNGFIVYDAYRSFWFLYDNEQFGNGVEDIRDKKIKGFLNKLFSHFKQYSTKELEEFYNEDLAWIETWQEEKKEPKVEFNSEVLNFYETFLDNHLRYIEQRVSN